MQNQVLTVDQTVKGSQFRRDPPVRPPFQLKSPLPSVNSSTVKASVSLSVVYYVEYRIDLTTLLEPWSVETELDLTLYPTLSLFLPPATVPLRERQLFAATPGRAGRVNMRFIRRVVTVSPLAQRGPYQVARKGLPR